MQFYLFGNSYNGLFAYTYTTYILNFLSMRGDCFSPSRRKRSLLLPLQCLSLYHARFHVLQTRVKTICKYVHKLR